MTYAKDEFSGDYLSMYNIIKGHGDATVKEIYSYQEVASEIDAYPDTAGQWKDGLVTAVRSVDQACNGYYGYTSMVVSKARVVYEVLYPDLEQLKTTITDYNNSIDQWYRIKALLDAAREEAARRGETQ